MLTVRMPKFDFSNFRAHWSPNHEFAQSYNAASITPAHIEPYLVKVMTWGKKELDPSFEELHRDVALFIKQEWQHCRQHLAFNKLLRASGYEGLIDIENEYKSDYEMFLATKSLKFNLAYSEGFEALGCLSAEVWFGKIDALLEGADESAVAMWKWHLAEEFEHREVCHSLYKALYCRGLWNSIVNGYFYRIYGFFYAVRHIQGYIDRAAAFLLNKDRERMTDAEVQMSRARELQTKKLVQRASRPGFFAVLSPFYNPGKKQPTSAMNELLARYT